FSLESGQDPTKHVFALRRVSPIRPLRFPRLLERGVEDDPRYNLIGIIIVSVIAGSHGLDIGQAGGDFTESSWQKKPLPQSVVRASNCQQPHVKAAGRSSSSSSSSSSGVEREEIESVSTFSTDRSTTSPQSENGALEFDDQPLELIFRFDP
ncbi:hypothetical protein E4U43_004654, partial [Claviceps pusilla]